MNSSTVSTRAPEPLWLRVSRSIVAIALALVLTILTALIVLGYVPTVRAAFAPLFEFEGQTPKVAITLAIAFIVFLPLLLLFVTARLRWLTWKVLLACWAVVLPVLGWLAWDESSFRQPVSLEEFSPAFPGAEQSYVVILQYSNKTPSEEARAYDKVKLAFRSFSVVPKDADQWLEFVTKNRAALAADWNILAPQRRWFAELATFDRLGDLTPADLEANMMTFAVWRTLSYHICGHATLQALDGQGDDAVSTLLPLLEVSRKLQLSSRSLIRNMIAEVMERMALQTAGIALDHTAVSSAARDGLRAALANENAPALARRLVVVEYAHYAPVYHTMKMGDLLVAQNAALAPVRHALNLLSRLFFNPNATMNLFGEDIRELAILAENRELGKLAVRSESFRQGQLLKPGIKNLGGRLLLTIAVPGYGKVLEYHWVTADVRVALRERLAAGK